MPKPKIGDVRDLYEPEPYTETAEDDGITCGVCQCGNASDARFCDQCGAELINGNRAPYDPEGDPIECPTCKLGNDTDARYCDQCGTRLANSYGPRSKRADMSEIDVEDAISALKAAGYTSQQVIDALGLDDDNPNDIEDPMGMVRSAEMRNVVREFRFDAEPGDGRTLSGIVSTFGDWTEIEDQKGIFREQVSPSAFNKTLRERKPVVMFNHGRHPMVGDLPIGAIQSIQPRTKGLYTEVRLADNWLVDPVRDVIANGSIPGMSFQFDVVKDDWSVGADGVPERTLKEVKLFEFGPVVFPAYTNTNVSVRSRDALTLLADPEGRAEIARLMLGTPPGAATGEPRKHSRTQSQNRALVRLSLNRQGETK